MEHISRGTVGIPDILLIVSDPGARGIRTAARIHDIAQEIGFSDEQQYLIFNRYRSGTADVPTGSLRTIARIPEDLAVEAADLAGKPIVSIPAESPARQEVRQLAGAVMTICREKKKS
jgi:CO dehydrogenase maturation factor